ncbi:hypothetical protein [Patulibacter sp. SYSU D01012]|uniref:hypothetical protein n=1 Tax=Patulibacter sp. SYSU D01012 TaxID=2817381 RepID=UPI001B3042CE|nr:hypothetical protein [Patulibacter sp. SYSU D01012]
MASADDRPARLANAARNAQASSGRFARWHGARAALWRLLERHVADGARVAVVGAGNAHDVPLGRLGRRAGAVDLVDLDVRAVRPAAERAGRRVRFVVEDVTLGAADALVRRASGEAVPAPDLAALAPTPVARAPYDVAVADLCLTQLLYPALRDAGLTSRAVGEALERDGQPLTDAVAARLHASTPGGLVVYVHDLLGWWRGHPQPFPLDAVLERAAGDGPDAALALAATGTVPRGCDPRTALVRAGAQVVDTAFWRWPFAPGVDYLVCATVARSPAAG